MVPPALPPLMSCTTCGAYSNQIFNAVLPLHDVTCSICRTIFYHLLWCCVVCITLLPMVGVLLCNRNVVMKLISMAVVCSVIDSCVGGWVRACVRACV